MRPGRFQVVWTISAGVRFREYRIMKSR
ncbi:flagellar export protein FliJ, partial [Mesorhizobium sp. M7A.F.Ca.AU.001.01.1.1]